MTKDYPWGKGTVKTSATGAQAITNAGFRLTVPAGKVWKMMSQSSQLDPSATVGNRTLVVFVYNQNDAVMWAGTISGNIAAGAIGGYDISYGAVGAPSTSVRRLFDNSGNTSVQVRDWFGCLVLNAGWYVLFDDTADIDPADTIDIRSTYVEYDA